MDIITTILIVGVAAQGITGAALILAGPIYAWNGDSRREEPSTALPCDYRWLDRTHKTTATEDKE